MLFREKSLPELFFETLVSWWWVILFVIVCCFSYIEVSKKKSESYDKISFRLDDLRKKRDMILKERADLMQQINSQSDPLWIERVLMKGLGLVPEGQKKILFKDD